MTGDPRAARPADSVTAVERPNSALRQFARKLGSITWLTQHDPAADRGGGIDRQIGYPTSFGNDAGQMRQRLGAAQVGVLGVGAIGVALAQHLVRAGVRELWLIDHNRSALQNALKQTPAARIHQLDRQVADPADLDALPEATDLLLVAAGTSEATGHIAWQWARPRDVAVCFAAVGLGTGYWGPLLVPGRGHCWHCFENARKEKVSADKSTAESTSSAPLPYSFGPANSTVSALCAHEAVRYLATGDCALMNGRWQIRLADNSTSFLAGPPTCHCPAETSRDRFSRPAALPGQLI
jgi:ThiF family protein